VVARVDPFAPVARVVCVAVALAGSAAACTLLNTRGDYEGGQQGLEGGATGHRDRDQVLEPPGSGELDAGVLDGGGAEADAGTRCSYPLEDVYILMGRQYKDGRRAFVYTTSKDEVVALTGSLEPAAAAPDRSHRNLGVAFRVPVSSFVPVGGVSVMPVHRLLNPSTGDRLYTADDKLREEAQAKGWSTYEGVAFTVEKSDDAELATTCTVPVEGYVKSDMHGLAVTAAHRAVFVDTGYTTEGVRFRAAPP